MAQKLIRLYQDVKLNKGIEYLFSPTAAHYVINVMRLKKDDPFLVFNGIDGEWQATVTDVQKKKVFYVVQHLTRTQNIDNKRALIFSSLKPHRLMFLLEKATELGVTDFYPIKTQHTSIHGFNHDKAVAHVTEAAEQCERLTLPTIHPLRTLTTVLESSCLIDHTLIIGDERRLAPSLSNILHHNNIDVTQPVAILIGPEGGFSTTEFNYLERYEKCISVTLGQTILRSETAALAALAFFHCR